MHWLACPSAGAAPNATPAAWAHAQTTCRLAGHLAAALRATPASLDAFLHIADLLTVASAFLADFRALAAEVLVVGRIQQHEMRRRAADFGARHHQTEMPRLRVLPACFQAM